jgi:hypothetical protein
MIVIDHRQSWHKHHILCRAALAWTIFIQICILMSTAILIIQSLYGMHENQLLKKLEKAEVCINIILAVELIMRAGTCPTFWKLAVDVQTWLDTLALLGALLAMVRVETSHVVSEHLSPV